MRSLCLLTMATLLAACIPTAQAQWPATTRSPYGQPRYSDPLGITIHDPVEEINRSLGLHRYSGPGMGLRPTDSLLRFDSFGRPVGGPTHIYPPLGPSYPGVTTIDRSPFRGLRQLRDEEERRGGISSLPPVVPHVSFPHSATGAPKVTTPAYKVPTHEIKLPEYKVPPRSSSFPWWLGAGIGAGVSGIAALFRGLFQREQGS